MSARSNAEREADRLDSVPLDEVGRVLAHGLPGVIYALLDVADAIREQTAALDLGSIRADLDDISHGVTRAGAS